MKQLIWAVLLWSAVAVASDQFAIRSFEIEGARLVPVAQLQQHLSGLLGEARSFADLQAAREAIAAAYAERGYGAVEVSLPPQDVTAGAVRLVVTEVTVGEVQVRGGEHFDAANVLATLPGLRTGAALNTDSVRGQLAQANRHESKQTRVRFTPSSTIPGGVDAVVQVEDRSPQGFGLLADNTGSRESGRLRTGLSYRNSNLFNRDHVFNLQYTTQPERLEDTRIFGLQYQVPFYGLDQTLDLTLGYSDVDSGDVGGIFVITGRGRTYGLRYGFQLPPRGALQQQFALGGDWREFHNSVRFMGEGPSLVPDVTLRPVSLSYAAALAWSGGNSGFNLAFSRNLPGGRDGDAAALERNRAGAEAAYRVLRYGLSHARALGTAMELRLQLDGQYSPDLLVSGEQFGVGGAGSVRGFDARGLTDDEGQHASLEWHLSPWQPTGLKGAQLRPLLFADYGQVQRNSPAVLERGSAHISSAGLGLRADWRRRVALSLDYGFVIDDAGLQDPGSGYLHASLQARI